ncbi:MAG TPA: sulfur carrier protein ThiS [bacterium]|nr:sulfur carrier protein ThiS [bacterium]
MFLTVNGRKHEHQGNGTLLSLLGEIGAEAKRVAVVLNDEVVPRTSFECTDLKPDDRVEILTFAGGG